MIKFFPIILLLFIGIRLQAQKDKVDYYAYRNMLGLNATNILGNLLSINPNNTNSPYSVSYRRLGRKQGFRSGIHLNYRNSESAEGLIFNNSERTFLLASIGYERYLNVHKRFLFSYGIDIFGSYDKETLVQNFFLGSGGVSTFTSEFDKKSFGGGPFIRFEYKVSSRLYLSTESSLTYSRSDSKRVFNDGIINASDNVSHINELELILPQALFVHVAF
ncbi:MAG: hypothetical protein R2774_02500 [Saprospiraceae bacterium]